MKAIAWNRSHAGSWHWKRLVLSGGRHRSQKPALIREKPLPLGENMATSRSNSNNTDFDLKTWRDAWFLLEDVAPVIIALKGQRTDKSVDTQALREKTLWVKEMTTHSQAGLGVLQRHTGSQMQKGVVCHWVLSYGALPTSSSTSSSSSPSSSPSLFLLFLYF